MRPVWNTPHTNLFKWWFLDHVETFRIVKPVITDYYLKLVSEEETHIKLPTIMGLAKYARLNVCAYPWRTDLTNEACLLLCQSGMAASSYEVLIGEQLNYLLLKESEETHHRLLNILVLLSCGDQHKRKDRQFLRARDTLVEAVIHLGYGDILWLYLYRLMDLGPQPVFRRVDKERTSDLLLAYLRRQTSSMMSIVTLTETFEMRTMSLFRSVVSLLVRSSRRQEATALCEWIRVTMHVEDPSFYLRENDRKDLYLQGSIVVLCHEPYHQHTTGMHKFSECNLAF